MTAPGLPQKASTALLVLHALRCMGFAGLARIAEATGLDEAGVEAELLDLAVAGLASHLSGSFGGWGLTEAGKAVDAERIAAELDASGAKPAVEDAYAAFLVLNPELLEICAAWQSPASQGAAQPAGTGGRMHESRVLDRLADLHRRVQPVCGDLATALARFGPYRVRLAGALARAQAGETEFVTDGTSSYHSVWFQLHEDLLVTLGIPRW